MKPYAKNRRRDDDEPQRAAKPKSQCSYEDCEALWTHSDVAGSHTGMCGYHYHLKRGHEDLADWQRRNELARKEANLMRLKLPRYDLPNVKDAPADGVFVRAEQRMRRRQGEPA